MGFTRKLGHVGWAAMLVGGLLLVGCGQGAEGSAEAEGREGTIAVSGAFALYPMMIRWGEEYHQLHPEITFDISAGGAGKGLADALSGAVDIGMVSRPIYEEEIQRGAFWVTVGKDAVLVTINDGNPVADQLLAQGLRRDTAERIWIKGEVTTWGEVVDSEVGHAIHVYTRADACGAAQTWADYLGGYSQEDLRGIAVQADPGLLEAVSRDRLAIGYNNLNFVYDPDTGAPVAGIQVVPLVLDSDSSIEAGDHYGTKAEMMEAIVEGRYPSPPARDLNLVTRGKPDGAVKDFLEWVLTEGQEYLAEVGYVGVGPEQLAESLAKLE